MGTSSILERPIKCPNCGEPISLDATLGTQLAEEAEEKIRKQFEAQARADRETIEQQAIERAAAATSLELTDLRSQLAERNKKVADSEERELVLLKKTRELEEREKNIDLNTERRLAEEKHAVEEETAKRVAGQYELKLSEKEKQINDARKQADEFKRKMEQGSQQTQGETVELVLEERLRTLFLYDEILPVPKGVNGADVMQKVRDGRGRECGVILWEAKQTKAWSQGWVQKLKEDQRQVKAEMAILVSKILPPEIKSFGDIDGIYVTNFECIFPVANVLRAQLIQVAATKRSSIGKSEKMEVVWHYLHGTAFKQRVEAILEAFSAMSATLNKEKKAMTRIWAEREMQIKQVVDNTIGMHGDLQGLAGGSMPTIQSLELPLLEENNEVAYGTQTEIMLD
jgi:hypothetical protein